MNEVWKAVPGFEGLYEVSNLGHVRSLDRYVTYSGSVKGTYQSFRRGRLLKPGKMSSGHLSVALGKGNSRCVHDLVLTAFVGPRPEGMECRHRDGDESNNRLANLKWDTRGNNNRDKKWHKGCAQYKLKPHEISEIKRCLVTRSRGEYQRLAKQFNVSISTIHLIRAEEIHIDVRSDYRL